MNLATMEMKPLVDRRPWPQNEYAMPSSEESELDRDQKIVLISTRTFKPSYRGVRNLRLAQARKQTGITPERWESAKASLIASGYLTTAGALTPKGKNAAGQTKLYALGESRLHRTFSQLCLLAEQRSIVPGYGAFIVLAEQYDRWRGWKEGSLADKQAGREPRPMPEDIKIYVVTGWFCAKRSPSRTGNQMWDTHGSDVWKTVPSEQSLRLKPCSRRDATHVKGEPGNSKIPPIIKSLRDIAVIGRAKISPEQAAQAEKEWNETRVKPRQ